MLPVIHVGPLVLQTPGLILILGLWLGLSLIEKYADQAPVRSDRLYNLVLVGLLSWLVGARLFYTVQHSAAFLQSPASIFALSPVMMDWGGGLLAGVLGAWIYAQRTGLAGWQTLDALTPFLGVFMLALGLSHLASGEAYGLPADLPWSIDLWGTRRHPTQVYETILAAVVVAVVWPGRRRRGEKQAWPAGIIFLTYVALSALSQLAVDPFRAEGQGALRWVQWGAWIGLAISLYLIGEKRFGGNSPDTKPEMQ
ncbi:MAG: hypothetical protein GYA17_06820 [Chloroflexi bacterium]|nr:hypothetical protein [Chloroflexota bacterium]